MHNVHNCACKPCLSQSNHCIPGNMVSNDIMQADIDKHLVMATWLFFGPRVIQAVSLFLEQQQQEKGISKEKANGLVAGQLLDLSDIKALKEHLHNVDLLHDEHGRDLVQMLKCMGIQSFGTHTHTLSCRVVAQFLIAHWAQSSGIDISAEVNCVFMHHHLSSQSEFFQAILSHAAAFNAQHQTLSAELFEAQHAMLQHDWKERISSTWKIS